MHEDIDRELISADDIAKQVTNIADKLCADIDSNRIDRLVLMPVMTGAMVFTADLIRRMPRKLSIEIISVSSYSGATTESRGASLRSAMPESIAGSDVIIIDDILDSGQTMSLLMNATQHAGAQSVRSCVLLTKPARRTIDIDATYAGFEIPDEFVVGYGLDYDGYYRNLPNICVLKPHVYSGAAE